MLIALINDTHHDCRGGNQTIAKHQKKFWHEWFWPKVSELGITHIIHLGDIVDDRKGIDLRSLAALRDDVFAPAAKLNVPIDIILGNHDVYYKNTNRVNIMDSLFDSQSTLIRWYTEPTEVARDGLKMLFLPWINSENKEKSFQMIEDTTALIALGHLEFAGFDMYRGSPSHAGYSTKPFEKFEAVYTGHYHHKSTKGNIHYLGAQFEMTWSDAGDERGFHVFDTDTRELTYIKTPFNLFYKILYDDSDSAGSGPISCVGSVYEKLEDLKDCYVKVIVRKKNDPYRFDRFIETLEKDIGVANLQIVDDHMNLDTEGDEEIIDQSQDTFTIIKGFAEQILESNKTSVTIEELSAILGDVYKEASLIEDDA